MTPRTSVFASQPGAASLFLPYKLTDGNVIYPTDGKWKYDKELARLHFGLEQAKNRNKQKHQVHGPCFIHCLRPGNKAVKEPGGTWVLVRVSDWEMRVDIRRQLKFSEETVVTNV